MKPTGEGNIGLLVLASSPGDEIVSATAEALQRASATYAWIVARGTLREAMITAAEERVVPGPLQFASASGTYRAGDEAIDLTAMVTTPGGDVVGGRFAMAVAEEVELLCFVAAPRATAGPRASDRAAAPHPAAAAAPTAEPPVAAPPLVPSPAPEAPTPTGGAIELGPSTLTADVRPPSPSPSDPGYPGPAGASSVGVGAAIIPPKLTRRVEEEANVPEPEAGDRVTHFAFGDCDVESSDGDRIRLKQHKDDRVREVSLAMLRIEAPTTLDDGRRHFRLLRKN